HEFTFVQVVIAPRFPGRPQAGKVERRDGNGVSSSPQVHQRLTWPLRPHWRVDSAVSICGDIAHHDILIETVRVCDAATAIERAKGIVRNNDDDLERLLAVMEI